MVLADGRRLPVTVEVGEANDAGEVPRSQWRASQYGRRTKEKVEKGGASLPLAEAFLVAKDGVTDSVNLPLRLPMQPEETVVVERTPLLATGDFERLSVEPAGGGAFAVSVALNKAARKKYSAACEQNLGREFVWVIDGVARTRGVLGYAVPGGGYSVDIDESAGAAKDLQTRFAAALSANPSPRRAHPTLSAAEWDATPKRDEARSAYDVFILSQLTSGWVHVTAMQPLHSALVEAVNVSPALHKLRRRLETDEWWKPAEVAAFLDETAALNADVPGVAAGRASLDQAKNGKPERPKAPR